MPKFPKKEKLCGQQRIQSLYREGQKLTVWPFRVTVRRGAFESPSPTKILIWAPKSLFKHAVDRNRLRRQMREVYRLHKQGMEDLGWEIAFNYIDRQLQPFSVLEKAMVRALKKIQPASHIS